MQLLGQVGVFVEKAADLAHPVAGVVHEDVDVSEVSENLVPDALDVGRDIGDHAEGSVTKVGYQRFRALAIDVDRCDPSPVFNEQPARRLSDPARSTGDDGNPPAQEPPWSFHEIARRVVHDRALLPPNVTFGFPNVRLELDLPQSKTFGLNLAEPGNKWQRQHPPWDPPRIREP